MTLKEKLCEPFGGLKTETVNELEQIADEFAIGFGDWLPNVSYVIQEAYTTKELLEIYKKETGL